MKIISTHLWLVRSVMRHGAESRKKVAHCGFESHPGDNEIGWVIKDNKMLAPIVWLKPTAKHLVRWQNGKRISPSLIHIISGYGIY